MEVAGCVILITGAAQRVGRAVALDLAAHGALVAFSYYTEDEPWRETLAELRARSGNALAMRADVTHLDEARALVEATLAHFGRVDVLINNASIWLQRPALELQESEWEATFAVNAKAPFFLAQAVAPHMLRQGRGVILNLADLSAFQAWTGYAHHAASKAALVALTRVLALEWAPSIRVNAIAPGTVLLPENADEAKRRWAVEKSALKRIGDPMDVARTVRYLIEEDFATGAVYFVDGGRSLV
ncbi:MAG: SDR family oxidoreductase [Thermoflexales bacterium]|nr:SDR family oxidoreductase [Thermoflexales bacterium]MCS7324940.1 SDR family oxidoreductase [Thermoflexales bacterium]MDW8054299.1 SDR family oxidoreductase [Anaerolineae bacterium]MDW8291539.1 SDR family oxidoreductase [Anaerolineae bacterium]